MEDQNCLLLNAYIDYKILLKTHKALSGISPECFHWFICCISAVLHSISLSSYKIKKLCGMNTHCNLNTLFEEYFVSISFIKAQFNELCYKHG